MSPADRFKPKRGFDRVFEVGILLKGLDGLLEIDGGIRLLFIKPELVNHLAATLTHHELAEDPHDFLATTDSPTHTRSASSC
jgi:uncharacterized membrane protein